VEANYNNEYAHEEIRRRVELVIKCVLDQRSLDPLTLKLLFYTYYMKVYPTQHQLYSYKFTTSQTDQN